MLPLRTCFRLLASTAFLILNGCGGVNNNCVSIGMAVTPGSATADHAAAAPRNGQTFEALSMTMGHGCEGTSALVPSNWTTSDDSVQLSASPSGQVTAICTAAVPGPITISATSNDSRKLSSQATLVCN